MAFSKNTVVLDRGCNTTCTVNLHGATVVSWRVKNQEQLFVSRQAVYNDKPICGGIPIVFLHFGPWTFGPQHGFARIVCWNIEKAPKQLASRDVEATFSLRDDDFTRSMWNYQFKLTYHLILKERELHCHIIVHNSSKELTFKFNTLLHTYFKVPDVRQCQIMGLQGCTFIDKTDTVEIKHQEDRDVVTIEQWTDRIYLSTPQEHVITNVVADRPMKIRKTNFPDTIIWNPWTDHSKAMGGFGDDEYLKMICIEVGHINPVMLPPDVTFEASQILYLPSDLTSSLYPCI